MDEDYDDTRSDVLHILTFSDGFSTVALYRYGGRNVAAATISAGRNPGSEVDRL